MHFFYVFADNIIMKIFLIVMTIIVVLLTINLPIKAFLEYDILNNNGEIKVFVFWIVPIVIMNFSIAGEYLNFSNSRNKIIKIKLDINDEKVKFFNDLGSYFKRKIYLQNLGLYALVCSENPVISSTIGATLNALIGILFSIININKPDADLNKYISTGYRQTELRVRCNISIVFSLYDLIWALYMAYKKNLERRNEKSREFKQQGGIK